MNRNSRSSLFLSCAATLGLVVAGPTLAQDAVPAAISARTTADARLPAEAAAPEAAPDRSATRVIEDFCAALLAVMKRADALGYQGRYDELAPVLLRTYDLDFMARKAVGRHWKNLSEERREELVAIFRRLTIANYAGRFDGYSGQRFDIQDQEPAIRGTVVVHTQLIDTDGEIIQLDYRLRPVEGRWKIIDVYLNGTVSELALRRSEYSSVLQREGFDALLSALAEKIAKLSATDDNESS